MHASVTAGLVFVCLLAGGLLAGVIRPRLPQHHLSAESKDLLKQGLAIVGTMTALILGLLVASAKSSFDGESSEVTKMTANIVVLDRILAGYGPEAQEARRQLRVFTSEIIDSAWAKPSPGEPAQRFRRADALVQAVLSLSPHNETQRLAWQSASRLLIQLGTSRWTIVAEQVSPIPWPFLGTIIFWLTIIFFGMGLISPPNGTTVVVLLACAAAAAGAVLLILELYNPFHGVIRISPAPLKMALDQLGR